MTIYSCIFEAKRFKKIILNSLNLFELNKCPIVFDLNKDDNLYKYVVKIKSIRKNNDRKIKLKLGISTISRNTDLDDNLLTANKS